MRAHLNRDGFSLELTKPMTIISARSKNIMMIGMARLYIGEKVVCMKTASANENISRGVIGRIMVHSYYVN